MSSCFHVALQLTWTAMSYMQRTHRATGLSLELRMQGAHWHAVSTSSNEHPIGADRVSSFTLLGSTGVAGARLHKLTSRLLRSKPSTPAIAGTQSGHRSVVYEQQWHAAQPSAGLVDGCSRKGRACVPRLRLSCRAGARMGGAPEFSQSQAGKEPALMCAAILQKVQAGPHSLAWITWAAQAAGTFARCGSLLCCCADRQPVLHSLRTVVCQCRCGGWAAGSRHCRRHGLGCVEDGAG